MVQLPNRGLLRAGLGVLVGLLLMGAAAAQEAGRGRIVRMNGAPIEGEIKKVEDGYEVTVRKGIVVKVKFNEVAKIDWFETVSKDAGKEASDKPANGDDKDYDTELTDDDIRKLIGDDKPAAGEDVEATDDPLAPLPVNKSGVEEMKQLAGRNSQVLETPHFVLVYTSKSDLAKRLAARLEAIYRWVYRYMQMLEIPAKRPEYKLEIYFFGTEKEYRNYGATLGFPTEGALGFYYRVNNRSAFFDGNEDDRIVQLREALKDKSVDPDRRRYINNRIKRRQDWYNLTVLQHEAAHHIHFNMGVFNPRGDMQRWHTEGLATMFELPPSEAGGSLGATNHHRLNEYHQLYGKDGKGVGDLRLFLFDDGQFRGWASYSLSWAVHQFLWKTQREKYAEYMRKIAAREDDVELDSTKKQQEFEDIFGEVNDAWIKKFRDYIASLNLRTSVLPE
jgi:hypothetical protein